MSERILYEAKTVIMCPYCTFPVEYCEFSSNWAKCASSLKDTHPELFAQFKAAKDAKAAAAKAKAAATNPEKDGEKAEDAEGSEEKKEKEKKDGEDDDEDDEEIEFTDFIPTSGTGPKKEITVQVKERTRRKRVTIVTGVENFGLSAKEVAKAFSKKFATSASASDEGIILNGDLSYDIGDYMLDNYPDIPETAYISIQQGGIRRKMF